MPPKLAGCYYRNLPCLHEQRYLSDLRFWSSHPSSTISTIVHNCRPSSRMGAMKELAYGIGDRKIAQRHPCGSRCRQAVTICSLPKLVPKLQSSKMLRYELSLLVTECLGKQTTKYSRRTTVRPIIVDFHPLASLRWKNATIASHLFLKYRQMPLLFISFYARIETSTTGLVRQPGR